MTRAVSIAQGGSNNVTMRNRIINGNMMIDQRNAGASGNANGFYPVDRTLQLMSGGGVLTSQRSTTAPAGFTNSIYTQVTTADASIASTDYYLLRQVIEGFNLADMAWGTASAQPFTISFWVRSSVTGTFSGGVNNGAENRGYAFTYVINSANTWEYKTVTIAGDQSGTWATDNTQGMYVNFDLGSGSSRKAAAGSWVAQQTMGATGAVNLISTLNATFYITGVQLEAGTTATPFEQRLYGTELALCQRYCQIITRSSASNGVGISFKQSSDYLLTNITYQTMRSSPTWANAPTSWDTTGSPSATQAGAYDFTSSGFVTISGALSITNQLTASQGRFYFRASSSFSGGTGGGAFAMFMGADMILTAEL